MTAPDRTEQVVSAAWAAASTFLGPQIGVRLYRTRPTKHHDGRRALHEGAETAVYVGPPNHARRAAA